MVTTAPLGDRGILVSIFLCTKEECHIGCLSEYCGVGCVWDNLVERVAEHNIANNDFQAFSVSWGVLQVLTTAHREKDCNGEEAAGLEDSWLCVGE